MLLRRQYFLDLLLLRGDSKCLRLSGRQTEHWTYVLKKIPASFFYTVLCLLTPVVPSSTHSHRIQYTHTHRHKFRIVHMRTAGSCVDDEAMRLCVFAFACWENMRAAKCVLRAGASDRMEFAPSATMRARDRIANTHTNRKNCCGRPIKENTLSRYIHWLSPPRHLVVHGILLPVDFIIIIFSYYQLLTELAYQLWNYFCVL